MSSPLTLDAPTEIVPDLEDDISDFDGKAHYVKIKALVEGGPVVALCGKKWVPITIAEAQNYPTCKSCEDLFGLVQSMD